MNIYVCNIYVAYDFQDNSSRHAEYINVYLLYMNIIWRIVITNLINIYA